MCPIVSIQMSQVSFITSLLLWGFGLLPRTDGFPWGFDIDPEAEFTLYRHTED